MLYKLLLILLFSFVFDVNGNSCFNCVSTRYRYTFDKFINVPGNLKMMFPLEKYNCSTPTKITCNTECVGIKIEEISSKEHSIGYVYGCAEHVMPKKKIIKSPAPKAQKLCDKPLEYDINYHLSAKISYCRCQEELCNNPERDFVNADYIPPPSSQISTAGSEINHFGTAAISSSATTITASSLKSTSKAVTLASTVIGTNALSISLSSNHQIDPIKFILSNLISFMIYQMF